MEKYPFRRHLLLPQLQVIFCRNIADTTEEHSQKWTLPWEKKMNKTMVFNSRCEWCDTFILLILRLFLAISWGLFIKGGVKNWQMMIWRKSEAYNFKVIKYSHFAFSLSQELWTPAAGEQLWYLSLHALHTFPTFTTGHHHQVNIQRQLLFRNSTCVICQCRKSYFYHLILHGNSIEQIWGKALETRV